MIEDRALIDMAFNKKKADDRKEWLRGFVVSLRSNPVPAHVGKVLFRVVGVARPQPLEVLDLPPAAVVIDMAFNKKKADDRKEWLRGFVVSLRSNHR
jgi:Cft2 family RNA processing exonuclease